MSILSLTKLKHFLGGTTCSISHNRDCPCPFNIPRSHYTNYRSVSLQTTKIEKKLYDERVQVSNYLNNRNREIQKMFIDSTSEVAKRMERNE